MIDHVRNGRISAGDGALLLELRREVMIARDRRHRRWAAFIAICIGYTAVSGALALVRVFAEIVS